MGQQNAPTPEVHEGEVSGYEFNAANGRRYTFNGHFLGDRRIVYRATVLDAAGEFRGELTGVFDRARGAPPPRGEVEARLKESIRDSVGYRP